MRLVLGLLASATFLAPVAQAADILEPIPVIVEPEVPYSGWYIRGDVGYVFSSSTEGSFRTYSPYDNVYGDDFRYSNIEFENTYTLGGGVGYRVAEHFRVDATVDYYDFDVNGSSRCAYSFADTTCRYNDRSSADVWTAMANAYVDLPYLGPITPYFGAGIGAAYVSYGSMKNEICGDGTCGVDTNYVGYHDGEDSWRFATSLMAGASVDLTQQLALDLGYRYTHVYDGNAFGFDQGDKAAGATGVQGRDNGFDIHAVRAGLRYSFF